MPGWPQPMDCVATPSVADVDNDGVIEICAVSFHSIYLWDKDGNPEPGWPLLDVAGLASYAQPTIADLDGDGDLEIFGGGHSFDLGARHHTGEIVTGWPVTTTAALECSPIVFDLDNGGYRDVVFGENFWDPYGDFWAFSGDGLLLEDWPIDIVNATMVNSAAVGDVDSDGDIEIALIVKGGTVYLWTIENIPYRKYLTEWETYHHDNWNTGWFHPLSPQNLTAVISGSSVYLSWNANTGPDIAGYNIYRSDISGGPYTKINSTLVIDTSYTDPSGTYSNFYCVSAIIKACTESRLSDETSVQSGIETNEQFLYTSAYPNPFSINTTISFSIPTELTGNIELSIYNLSGRKVKTLINEISPSGKYSVVWNKTDYSGETVCPGMYFVCFSAGDFVNIEKVTLIESGRR